MNQATTKPEMASLLQRLDTQLERIDAQDTEIRRLRALVEPDDMKQKSRARSRRDLLKLAGAAVMGAAGAAALRVVPAAAANGDPVTVGGSFTGAGNETIISNTSGNGFGANGSLNRIGVYGSSSGVNSLGVRGTTDIGVGVFGGTNVGAGQGVGVFGASSNTQGIGVYASGAGASGLGGYFSGVRAALNLAPSIAAGPPASGAHSVGDLMVDLNGIVWACITGGTPGVCAPLQTGGANLTHFVKVSNKQYSLAGSDGQTWVDIDATGLGQVITPFFNAQAVISVSTDLWTANSGFNQDIGIFISGGAYGSGQIVAWKESGGSAGTFSPNAVFVETTQPFVAGTTYTIKVRWKTNQPAGAAIIFAGAGPLPAGSAGGGVAGQVSPTRLATHLVVDVPSPLTLRIPANDPSAIPPPPPLDPRRA